MENYQKIEKIGEGTYGIVFRGRRKDTGEIVAMKKIRIENDDEGIPSTAIREVSILRELRHPNIVALQDIIMEESRLYLIFEFLSCDLKKYLDRLEKRYLEESQVRSFVYQILDGILFCHKRRILHRDLKPQNLLVHNDVVKIADFGLGRTFGIPVRAFTHEVVTLWYRAPEVLLGTSRYSCPVDIWSIGCIFVELITKKPLFQGDSEIDQLFKIFRVLTTPNEESWPGVGNLPDYKPTFPNWNQNCLEETILDKLPSDRKLSPNCLDLLQKMFLYNPSGRISAKAAVLHPYFDPLDKTKLPGYGCN